VNLEQYQTRLTVMGAGGLARAIKGVLVTAAREVEEYAKSNVSESHKARTGHLRKSISAAVVEEGGKIVLVGRSTAPYAAMQEYGGIQRPKNAKYLRIPLGPTLTAAGVDRYAGPLRQTAPDKFYVREIGGKLFLCVDIVRKGKKGNVPQRTDLAYLLVKSVAIPARPFLGPAMARVAPTIGPRIRDALKAALGGVA